MNAINIIRKWLKIPAGEKSIEAVELWEVRWLSRHGAFHADVKPEVQVFTSEADAGDFKAALENAFTLLKHVGEGTGVTIKKVRA